MFLGIPVFVLDSKIKSVSVKTIKWTIFLDSHVRASDSALPQCAYFYDVDVNALAKFRWADRLQRCNALGSPVNPSVALTTRYGRNPKTEATRLKFVFQHGQREFFDLAPSLRKAEDLLTKQRRAYFLVEIVVGAHCQGNLSV